MKSMNIVALISLMALLAGPAYGQQDMVWYQGQTTDNQGAPSSFITFGVPETDDESVVGNCSAASGENFSNVIFSAPTYDLAQGSQVSIKFVGRNYNRDIAGIVYNSESGEGVSGVQLRLGNDDALWDALKILRRIQYQVRGQTLKLRLRGSADVISEFLNNCRSYTE